MRWPEKDRTIASVASSYGLVAQTIGNWVARYRKEYASDDGRQAAESAEIARLRAQNRELQQGCEFLKKVCHEGGVLHACVGDAVLCCVGHEGFDPSEPPCGRGLQTATCCATATRARVVETGGGGQCPCCPDGCLFACGLQLAMAWVLRAVRYTGPTRPHGPCSPWRGAELEPRGARSRQARLGGRVQQ